MGQFDVSDPVSSKAKRRPQGYLLHSGGVYMKNSYRPPYGSGYLGWVFRHLIQKHSDIVALTV